MTRPISREPIRRAVRRILLDRLLDRELPPGSHINESALAAEFGISRTPLREALLQLASEGLIEAHPGRGFSVAEMDTKTGREIYGLVAELEALALRRSGIPDPDTLAQLRDLDRQRARRPEEHDPSEAADLDIEWHRVLVADCPNRQLLELLEVLRQRAYRYEYGFLNDFTRVGLKGIKQHEAVLDALEEGDVEEAANRLLDHWAYAGRSLAAWLENADLAGGSPGAAT